MSLIDIVYPVVRGIARIISRRRFSLFDLFVIFVGVVMLEAGEYLTAVIFVILAGLMSVLAERLVDKG